MAVNAVSIDSEQIAEFCCRNGVRRLALFGSVLRSDWRKDSDIDMLIEFDGETRLGFGFFALQDQLSQIVGRPVDLHTYNSLSRYFRDSLELVIIYDTGRSSPAAART